MPKTKTTELPNESLETEITEPDTAVDAAEEIEDVYVPIDYSNEGDDKFYVAVNGVAMFVPKGQNVKVPKPYAQVIKNAQAERIKVTAKKKAAKID